MIDPIAVFQDRLALVAWSLVGVAAVVFLLFALVVRRRLSACYPLRDATPPED